VGCSHSKPLNTCAVISNVACLKRISGKQAYLTVKAIYTTASSICEGATENAGVENAAPDCRNGKRGSNEYGKPKFLLFNIVTSGLQQPIELM